jgi:hypothetical protein
MTRRTRLPGFPALLLCGALLAWSGAAGEGLPYYYLDLEPAPEPAPAYEATVRFCGIPVGLAGHADGTRPGRLRVTVFLGDAYTDLPRSDASWAMLRPGHLMLVDPGNGETVLSGDSEAAATARGLVPPARVRQAMRRACDFFPDEIWRKSFVGEYAARELARAFDVGEAPGLKPYLRATGPVEVRVQRAFGEPPARTLTLQGAAAVTRFLHELNAPAGGGPAPETDVRPLLACVQDRCEFGVVSGTNRRTVYLTRVFFAFDLAGRPFVTGFDLYGPEYAERLLLSDLR